MKIGFFHHTFMYGSGIDNVIRETADRLAVNNHVEINTFYCNRNDGRAKINIFSRSKKKSVFTGYNPLIAFEVIKSIRKYDLLITHIYPMNLLVSLGSIIFRKPHVAYFWGVPPSWMVQNFFEKMYYHFLHLTEKLIPKLGVRLSLVPNEFIKKWNKNKKAKILPMHGVDLKRFSFNEVDKNNMAHIRKRFGIPPQAHIIFTLGRVLPYKGVDLLIKILKKVRQKYPETYLIVGGCSWNEDYANHLKSISDSHTILAGLIPEEELVDFYGLCDIYVSASKWEGQLNAEALAMSKPYLAFDTTSHRYTIKDGENGYLIKPYDLNEFAEKIAFLFKNSKERKRLGRNSGNWAHENADYDSIVLRLEKFFLQIKNT